MIKLYLSIKKDYTKNWRIKKGREYQILFKISEYYFVWANGTIVAIKDGPEISIRKEEINEDYYWYESTRAWKKRKINRRNE